MGDELVMAFMQNPTLSLYFCSDSETARCMYKKQKNPAELIINSYTVWGVLMNMTRKAGPLPLHTFFHSLHVFGCQFDEPCGFPGDHRQNAAMFQYHVHTAIYQAFYDLISLLYYVGNKSYYYC